MTHRPAVTKITQLAEELASIVPRLRAISTDPRPMHMGHGQNVDTPMATLMAFEAGKAHNRSYIVTARAHAEQVLINREKGVTAEQAQQAWGLMRDMYELAPHSRICIKPDAPLGRKVNPDGSMDLIDGGYLPPNAHLSYLSTCVAQAAPDASLISIKGIRNGRARTFIELTDANGGLMLATDWNALAHILRSILVPSTTDDGKYDKRRLRTWMGQMGIEREEFALHGLSAIHTIARLDVADAWILNTSN
jgi:hypothetical protein